MECSIRFFKNLFKRRHRIYKDKCHLSGLHLSIVHRYLRHDLSRISTFRDLYISTFSYRDSETSDEVPPKVAASLTEHIRDVFTVPRLSESDEGIKGKNQLFEEFITFLLQLLHHKTADLMIDKRIEYLENELALLPTIHGDISLMLCGDDRGQVVDNVLLEELEAVANGVGNLVHCLFFSSDRAFEELDEGIALVLNDFDVLKANILRFLNRWSSTTHMITPKTSVVKSFLIVNSLIYHLEVLMDLHLIADVKDQIRTLHQGLIFLQPFIMDKGSPRLKVIGELKESLMRIGDIAYQAEYLIVSLIGEALPLWYISTRLADINHKTQLIGFNAVEIINKHKVRDSEDVMNSSKHEVSLQEKINLEVDDITVGFDDITTRILDQLLGGTKSQLQVISIFGMPGLGKTTLAKKLYNHPSTNYWFDKRSWCVVSQTYHKRNIMTSILVQILSSAQLENISILQEDVEILEEHIYKTLKGRRYLIVMDDIWDSDVWDDLRRCFPDDGNGSRIVLTTRNKDVCPPNSIMFAQPSMSNSQCWELLKKKVFNDKPCPYELIWIGREIAENCGGLPLVVVVIAGVLSPLDRKENTWAEVKRNLASYMFRGGDNSSVMQILELSYEHLPEYLKPCFLYFGMFEEDKEVPVRDLARLWIAEGFVYQKVGKSAEDVAEEYLNDLVDKSLVMVTKSRSDGGVKTCVIHDLLRDLCLQRSKQENFVKFWDLRASGKDLEHGDYSGHRLPAVEEYISWKYCDYIRNPHFVKYPISRIMYFRHSRFPRVLHCSYLAARFFRIERLVCLKYLVIGVLQAEISNLVNLEYLRVDSPYTVNLRSAILEMNKLRCIHVGLEAVYDADCTDSFRTNNIEFLSRIVIRELKDEEMLKRSPHLRRLKLSTSRDIDLSFLTQLESLNVESRGYYKMATIGFPENIKKLTLCSGKRRILCWENIAAIGRLEKLEVLKLESCAFEEGRWVTTDAEFQALTFLKMDSVNLTQWDVDSSGHFPKLKQLILRNCYNLKEIPCEIGEIASLEMIEVGGRYPNALVESAKSIQQQQLDMGYEQLRVNIKR